VDALTTCEVVDMQSFFNREHTIAELKVCVMLHEMLEGRAKELREQIEDQQKEEGVIDE
jgi:hypothetical protein